MAQSLNDIKSLLAARGLHPKKKHGQNFLHDGNHMERILEAAQLAAGDLVLEVGPGTGALTERLLDAGASVIACEIDSDMESILKARCADHPERGPRFTLIMGDALDGKHALNPRIIEALAGRPFKMVANLPYHVASPLIANLALDHAGMQAAIVMVQKEVADRLAAPPGGKEYGPLGIIIQAMFETKRVSVLAPGCFWPPPSIASAVAAMHRRAKPLCDDPHRFADLVHRLFATRRKQIGTILGRATALPPGIDPMARPESLSVEQMAALERWLEQPAQTPPAQPAQPL